MIPRHRQLLGRAFRMLRFISIGLLWLPCVLLALVAMFVGLAVACVRALVLMVVKRCGGSAAPDLA